MRRLKLWWAKLRRWYVDPFPAELGKKEREGQRRIPIELVFILAADGRVYHRRRKHDGDRLIEPLPEFRQSDGDLLRQVAELAAECHAEISHKRLLRLADLMDRYRLADQDIIAMVHTEYRWLVRQAKRRARIHGITGQDA